MPKLYLRLFLAICAVSTGVLLLNIVVADRIGRAAAAAEPDYAALARTVLDAYREGGPRALDDLHGDERTGNFDLLLFQDDRPVGRRPPPEPLHESLHELLRGQLVTRNLRHGELVFGLPVEVDGEDGWHVVGFRPPGQQPRPSAWALLGPQIAICVVAMALLSWVLARTLTAPLLSMQRAVRELADGRLDARAGTHLSSRGDEIGELARDVDRMAGQIQTLLKDRDRLLHDVSHELRAPLARLRLSLELARMDQGGDASPHLDQADKEIGRLDGLVDQVLTVARLDRNRHEMAREPIDVRSLLDDCAELARPEAEARQVRIEVKAESDCGLVGDAELLQRAFVNLLRNAVRYSPIGGTVTLRAVRAGSQLEVGVADQGPGAAAQDLPALFQPFFRGRNAASGSGYGLGLAIVARIVAAHGGTALARNRAEGGLEVACRLPATGRST